MTRTASFPVDDDGVPTAIVFDAPARFDAVPPFFAPPSDGLVVGPGQAGRYQISGSVAWDSNTIGVSRALSIRVNGVVVALEREQAAPFDEEDGFELAQTITTLWDLQEGDEVQLFVEKVGSAATSILKVEATSPELSMVRVSA